jgi:predicted ribosomally synthesized peptide with SipW-like signal peptide
MDEDIELTRRRVLASIGAVGAAGAATTAGTSALYNDTEEFENNTLTAGELDLKVDWEEHYSYPQIYGFDDPEAGVDVTRSEPSDPANYVALPDPTDPVVWVHESDFQEYFQNTTIEAFPDAVGGPVQADFDAEQPCEVLADVPGDLGTFNSEVDSPARTKNDDTFDQDEDEGLPLINLTDVKPGDYGELTLSTHLCFNDGYLWLQMPGGLTESENGQEEPEASVDDTPDTGDLAENVQTALWYDDNCSNTIDGAPDPLVAIALIDTSNSIGPQDMQTIAAASNEFVETLDAMSETQIAAGVMTFSGEDPNPGSGGPSIVLQNDVEVLEPGSAYLDPNGNGTFDPGNNLLPSEGSGDTPLTPALDLARELLNDRAETLIDTPGNGFGPNTRKTILLISDGLPTSPSFERYQLVDPAGNDVTAENAGVTNAPDGQFLSDIFDGTPDGSTDSTSIRDEAALVARDIDTGPQDDNGFGSDAPDISGENGISIRTVGLGTNNVSELNDFLTRIATTPDFFYNTTITTDLVDLVDDIVNQLNVTGPAEEVIFRGTLEEFERQLDPTQEGPVPLDGMTMGDDFDELNDPGDAPSRDPFDASATHCFGFAWWVPTSVGNVIQGDSASFDLQFVTEQARNNDDPTL